MSNIIRLQSSLFGNFSFLTPENKEMMNVYQKYIEIGLMPAVLKEFDLTKQELKNRPLFITQDNSFSVSIGSGRIDITSQDSENMPTEDEFVAKAQKYYEILFQSIGLLANRLSFIREKKIKEIDEEFDTVKEAEKYINFNKVYNKNDTFEWSIKTVSLEQWKLNELDENVNINVTISKQEMMRISEDKTPEITSMFTLSQDLNTKAINNQMRFDINHIQLFLHKSIEKSSDIENKVLTDG